MLKQINFKQQRITLNFEGLKLVILNFELPFPFLYASCKLFKKIGCFMWKLLFVKN